MNKSLLICVYVPIQGSEKKYAVSTGYPIGNDLIITTGHVFEKRDTDRPIKLHWYHFPGHAQKAIIDLPSGEMVPIEDQLSIDVAFIRSERPCGVSLESGQLSNSRPHGNDQWESEGFPSVAVTSTGCKPLNFTGSVHSMAEEDSVFDLDVGNSLKQKNLKDEEKAAYKGVSGMPIFVDGKIIGIVQSVNTLFQDGRLHAVPAWKLLQNEKIQDLINSSEDMPIRLPQEVVFEV